MISSANEFFQNQGETDLYDIKPKLKKVKKVSASSSTGNAVSDEKKTQKAQSIIGIPLIKENKLEEKCNQLDDMQFKAAEIDNEHKADHMRTYSQQTDSYKVSSETSIFCEELI